VKLVRVQFVLTDTQTCGLLAVSRGNLKGWGVPDDLSEQTMLELRGLGLVGSADTLTHAGELVITATGLESVVRQ